MKNNKGVTVVSLTIYIVTLVVILLILTFITSNFTSQVEGVVEKGKLTNQYIRLYGFIVPDIKNANVVTDYTDTYVKFDNGVEYTIKQKANNTIDIYRNDARVVQGLLDASFDYSGYEENILTINTSAKEKDYTSQKTQAFKVGGGY